MSNGHDDGHRAIAGFFFQLLGSGAELVDVTEPISEPDRVELVFTLEDLGQDATTAAKDGAVKTIRLSQYKFSSAPHSHPIEKSELYDILDKLYASAERARANGFGAVEYQLVTNRSLSEKSLSLKTDAESDAENPELDGRDTKKDGAGKVVVVRSKPQKKRLREVLKHLKVVQLDIQSAKATLSRHASLLGMLPDEMPGAVNRVVARILEKASSPFRRLSIKELESELAGFENPNRLSDVSVRDSQVRRVQEFEADAQEYTLLPRQIVADVAALALKHALVVVVGPGGSGKTITLGQVVRSIVSSDGDRQQFAVIDFAQNIGRNWLSQEVAKWRNSTHPAHGNEPIERAIMRLIASTHESTVRPVVILALDATDEVEHGEARRTEITKLLRFFHQEEQKVEPDGPRATLILTCRTLEELSELDASGKGLRGPDAVVSNGNFDYLEIAQLSSKALRLSVAERIETHAVDRGLDPDSTSPIPLRDVPSKKRPVDELAFEAIRHPIIWNCFERFDDQDQHAVLDGDRAGLDLLSREVVAWFCRKAHRRNGLLSRDEIDGVLREVAGEFSDAQRVGNRDDDWNAPARQVVGELSARRLWREAESAGLILVESRSAWRWRHVFICEYLRDNDD